MIEGLNEASNELGELAAGSEEAEERWVLTESSSAS